jgi:hypothetical protein
LFYLLFKALRRFDGATWGVRRRPPQLIWGKTVAIVLSGRLARNLAQNRLPFSSRRDALTHA